MHARNLAAAATALVCVLILQLQAPCRAEPYSATDTARRQLLTTDTASSQTYLVAYHKEHAGSGLPGHESAVASAGGRVVAVHPKIAVVVARSASEGFAADVKASDSRILAVTSTAHSARRHGNPAPSEMKRTNGAVRKLLKAAAADVGARASSSWGDPLSHLQWNMHAIGVPTAQQTTTGSKQVTVGILDTGIDSNHPDLKDQIDHSQSASCVGGVLNTTQAAYQDSFGHGTWCAGCVAAAKNGHGVVGVAPGVKLAAVRVADKGGLFYSEAVVCAFMHAANMKMQVTSNSWYGDPWKYNCAFAPSQNAILIAETRAIAYAISRGVTIVAAAGNDNVDLGHLSGMHDISSPNNGNPIARKISNACREVPIMVPGVIGVSSTGVNGNKAYYSNYATRFVTIAAPGGDGVYQLSSAAQNGEVLSTWPSASALSDGADYPLLNDGVGGHYGYLQGTSMAAPHVAGVAALIISRTATKRMAPSAVASALIATALPKACPKRRPWYPSVDGQFPASCTKSAHGHTSFFGAGLVNAAAAVKPAAKPHPKPHPAPHTKPHAKPHAKTGR